MATKGMSAFLEQVRKDEGLQGQIAAAADADAMVAVMVRLGKEHGYTFSAAEAASYLGEGELDESALGLATGGTIFRVNEKDPPVIIKASAEHTCTVRISGRCENPSR